MALRICYVAFYIIENVMKIRPKIEIHRVAIPDTIFYTVCVQFADNKKTTLPQTCVFICNMSHINIEKGAGVTHIQMTQGKIAVVDTSCLDRLSDVDRFYPVRMGGTWYVQTGKGILHTLLCPQWELVDHINGDGLDNRLCNLRDGKLIGVTGSTVQHENRRLRTDNRSGLRNLHCGKRAIRIQWSEAGETTLKDIPYGDNPLEAYLQARRELLEAEDRIGIRRHTDGDRKSYETVDDIPADICAYIMGAKETEEERAERLARRRKTERPAYANETEAEAKERRRKKAERQRNWLARNPDKREEANKRRRIAQENRKDLGPISAQSGTGLRGVCWVEGNQAYMAHWYEGGEQRKRTFRVSACGSKEEAFRRAKEARERGIAGKDQNPANHNNKLGLPGIYPRPSKAGHCDLVVSWPTGERDAKGRKKMKNCRVRLDETNPRASLEEAVKRQAEATGQEPPEITEEMCQRALAAVA